MGEVEAHVRAGQGLFEPFTGDGVDAAVGRGGDSLVAVLAQNGNGLRADQAGAADDDDLHGLPSLVDDWRALNANTSEKKSGPQRACIIASVRNTPLVVPLATERNPSKRGCRGICSLAKCSGSKFFHCSGPRTPQEPTFERTSSGIVSCADTGHRLAILLLQHVSPLSPAPALNNRRCFGSRNHGCASARVTCRVAALAPQVSNISGPSSLPTTASCPGCMAKRSRAADSGPARSRSTTTAIMRVS